MKRKNGYEVGHPLRLSMPSSAERDEATARKTVQQQNGNGLVRSPPFLLLYAAGRAGRTAEPGGYGLQYDLPIISYHIISYHIILYYIM